MLSTGLYFWSYTRLYFSIKTEVHQERIVSLNTGGKFDPTLQNMLLKQLYLKNKIFKEDMQGKQILKDERKKNENRIEGVPNSALKYDVKSIDVRCRCSWIILCTTVRKKSMSSA